VLLCAVSYSRQRRPPPTLAEHSAGCAGFCCRHFKENSWSINLASLFSARARRSFACPLCGGRGAAAGIGRETGPESGTSRTGGRTLFPVVNIAPAKGWARRRASRSQRREPPLPASPKVLEPSALALRAAERRTVLVAETKRAAPSPTTAKRHQRVDHENRVMKEKPARGVPRRQTVLRCLARRPTATGHRRKPARCFLDGFAFTFRHGAGRQRFFMWLTRMQLMRFSVHGRAPTRLPAARAVKGDGSSPPGRSITIGPKMSLPAKTAARLVCDGSGSNSKRGRTRGWTRRRDAPPSGSSI